MRILIIFFAFCLLNEPIFSKTGNQAKVSGVITDAQSGDKLIGATVRIEGTSKGAKTNVNGEFKLVVDAGNYSIKVSCLGYKSKLLTNTELRADETKHIEIALDVEAVKGEEIIVTTHLETETQAAQLLARKSSNSMDDFISGEQIRRSPDATSSDALKRISGVSIVDNKFVEIRGTSERYNNATLNGSALSSTEPDKKAFSFDLLPANLIDNTVVAKTFTPDLPANFAGGLVQVNTVNFPDKFNARFAISEGYNTVTTGKSFTTYQTGKSDWLGGDDGTRALPAGFPATSISSAAITPEQITQYGLLFKNNWAPVLSTSAANFGMNLSAGDQFTLFDNEFGYIASLSYKNGYDQSHIERNGYNGDGTAEYVRGGTSSTHSVLLGGLLNLTYKLGETSIISFRNLYDRSADDKVVVLAGADSANGIQDKQTSFHYTERTLYSGQLTGDHPFPIVDGGKLQWRLSHSATTRDEPDLRRYVYQRALDAAPNDVYYAALSPSADPKAGGRFFSNMNEGYTEGGLDVTLPLGGVKLKVGGLAGSRARDFAARVLAFKVANTSSFQLLFSSIDTLFAANHIGQQGFQIEEITNPSDKYDATELIDAGYGMLDVPFKLGSQNFRFIGGARIENDNQKLNSGVLGGGEIHYNRAHIDVLPSASLIYSASDQINFRIAATQTVSRPEFREIAPFSFYDFELGSVIQGDTNIDRALVRNLDFRFEFYPTAGELLSISIFHKRFEGAIEATNQGSNSVKSWANATEPAINYGAEFEIRKSLRFLGDFFSNFVVSANYAYIVSKVNVHKLSLGLQEDRPMQGQSPYSLNAGLLYFNPEVGTTVNLLYNTCGKRIAEVNPYTGDLYEMPRAVVDLSLSQQFLNRFEVKYTAKDILAQDQRFESGGKLERLNQKGATHSLGISVKF
ncbi:MAG: carboxypeptidase-like regulatory domain-containing protein [bacterium]